MQFSTFLIKNCAKPCTKRAKHFTGFYLPPTCLQILKVSYEYIEGFLRQGAPKWPKFRKFVLAPQKIWGMTGLTLPHRRVGSTTEILRVMEPPYISLPRFFVNFFKMSKIWPFLRGHSSAPGLNFEKMKKWVGVFRPKPSKNFLRHSDKGNPLKTPCSGTHPAKFFETVSNFGGSPRRG